MLPFYLGVCGCIELVAALDTATCTLSESCVRASGAIRNPYRQIAGVG